MALSTGSETVEEPAVGIPQEAGFPQKRHGAGFRIKKSAARLVAPRPDRNEPAKLRGRPHDNAGWGTLARNYHPDDARIAAGLARDLAVATTDLS